jgi:hypothetical protein
MGQLSAVVIGVVANRAFLRLFKYFSGTVRVSPARDGFSGETTEHPYILRIFVCASLKRIAADSFGIKAMRKARTGEIASPSISPAREKI